MADEGSNITVIREGLLRQLGLKGTSQSMALDVAGGGIQQVIPQSTRLEIRTSEGRQFTFNAMSLPKVCNPVPRINWPAIQHRWTHLRDLPLTETGGRIDLFVGLDLAWMLVPSETRKCAPEEPCGWRTELGWIVRGPVRATASFKMATIHLLHAQPEVSLEASFRRFYETESFVQPKTTEAAIQPKLSLDDQRATDIVNGGITQLVLGYEAALPWREGEPRIRNNRALVERRLANLERRFSRDPAFESAYRQSITAYEKERYAVEVTDPFELERPDQFYLPHHGVIKKTTRKLRVMFDAAAPFHGRSLIDALLTGPALQTQLPQISVKFREGKIAFTADIEAMFSRIRLRSEDARYHRFLWREKGSDRLRLLQMNRLTFGDRCSRWSSWSWGDSISQPLVRRFFWTDNSYVRNWLQSSSSAYKTCVSHRIGEIQATTAPEEWRYVPGGLNSSDLATWSSLISEDIPPIWFCAMDLHSYFSLRKMAERPSLAQTSGGAARWTHRPHSAPAKPARRTKLGQHPVRSSRLQQLHADGRTLAQLGEGLSAGLLRRRSRIFTSKRKGQEAIQPTEIDTIPERRWSSPSRRPHRRSQLTLRESTPGYFTCQASIDK